MASDQSRAMTQLCDITQCCICLKTFTDPRMLPCIHTFCLQCLQNLAEKSNKKPGDKIQCPVCRNVFTFPNDEIQYLQKNFFMASLIEVSHSFNQPKRALLCDICKVNNDPSDEQIPEAAMRCLVCQENLCEGCCKMHESFKMLRNHKIFKIGSEVCEEEVLKTLKVPNCDIHRQKPLDYYCANCKKIVCVSCFVESHNAHRCRDVNTVEDEFRENIKINASIISTLAGELKGKQEESKEEFLKKISTVESEILQRSKELRDMIDEHTKSLLSSLDEIKNRHLKEIQVDEEELERRLTILESFSRYCDELRTRGSASDVCRNKDELLRRANELEEDHEAYVMQPRVSFDVTFQATACDNNWPKTSNGNIIGLIKENVKQLKDIAVVIIGDQEIYKINLRYNNETVSSIQKLPTKVHGYICALAAAIYDNTMFVSGVGETLNEIWKYNLDSGWKRCGSLVQGREHHCAEFVGETLYICGGWLEDVLMSNIEAYNALTETSTTVGEMKIGTGFSTCVAYKGSIYIFGGREKDMIPLDFVQLYNPVENICTLLAMPLPRHFHSFESVLWENYAILLGHDTCFILDLNEMIWKERQQYKTDAKCFGMVAGNGRIIIVGGTHRDEVRYVRASSILNNEPVKWKTQVRLPKPTIVLPSQISL